MTPLYLERSSTNKQVIILDLPWYPNCSHLPEKSDSFCCRTFLRYGMIEHKQPDAAESVLLNEFGAAIIEENTEAAPWFGCCISISCFMHA